MTRITQQQLESYLWGAATLLRGTIDAGDYKQFIFPLLFFKRLCDVHDEETRNALLESGGNEEFAAFPENHRFQIPQEAHWGEVRKVAKNVGATLQSAMRSIETVNPDKLFGIFGDAQWTNKDRLPDSMLRDLIEHFSSLELSIENLPEDELGNGYEYLIKKFADDSGHTAAEFYTNRTVVHLMTELLQPQSGESVYDPTCGSGGMLLSCIAHLRKQNQEWRNMRLFGQERNLMTSAIARMNCFLHGIEDFRIERGDTLAQPKFVHGDKLQQFDIVLANPPYSIKQWDRDAFASDPWGRNILGTPPQGRADYAFWQHIIKSMDLKCGRCAILFPHGVLFRQEEAEMRRKLIEMDLIECVIGLGPNLFYNSPMEACIVICRMTKPKSRQNKILFIDAVGEVIREHAQSYLNTNHIERIVSRYRQFDEVTNFTRVASLEEIKKQNFSLNIRLYISNTEYVRTVIHNSGCTSDEAFSLWFTTLCDTRKLISTLINKTNDVAPPFIENCELFEPLWLDRSKWKKYQFDQIADNVRESVMPTPEDSAQYVGLEHIDSGSLLIRRWGSDADLIGQKLLMKKGDILFARRNAYLRRVAIAPHDGLFSAHGMILRAKKNVVMPEFLPYLMMSKKFMNRAVEISVGSLSPTVNWTTLQREEFLIPPLDQQYRIVNILKSVDEVVNSLYTQFEASRIVIQAAIDKEFSVSHTGGDVSYAKLDELTTKIVDGVHHMPDYQSSGVPFIVIENLNRGAGIDFSNTRYISQDDHEEFFKRANPEKGDVLVSKDGTLGIARYVETEQPFSIFVSVALLKPDKNRIDGRFLMYYIRSKLFWKHVQKSSSGSALKHIHLRDFKTALIPTISLEEQSKFIEKISTLEKLSNHIEEHQKNSKRLFIALLEGMT